MFQLIYTDQESYQYFFNLKTYEVAKIYRADLKKSANSSINSLSLFGFISLFMVMYRKTTFDFFSNKGFTLLLAYFGATILGSVLYYFAKKQQANELKKNRIDYSLEDLRKWLEKGNFDRSILFKLSLLLILLSTIVSLVFLFSPEHLFTLPVFFIAWILGIFFLCEPALYQLTYKNRLNSFCRLHKIKH